MDTDQIIAALGGREEAARKCGITTEAVKKWKRTGVPPKHWPLVVRETGGRVSYETLAALHSRAA